MNDLGLTLAWLAVQVTLVLVPALALYAMASRRGPVAGAWVASLSLGLVVMLNAAAFLPGIGLGAAAGPRAIATPGRRIRAGGLDPGRRPSRPASATPRASASGGGWPMSGWRVAWDRLGRGAAEPAVRFRPWGGVLAALAIAGTGAGLLRLMIGLGAVVACRRRGRTVDDPGMLGLLDELRGAIGCRPPVELREVPDLVGPATAGWRRPVILLPEDWRSWDDVRAPGGARARAGARRPGRLRGRPARPAGRGPERLSPDGPLDGGAAPLAAGTGGRRDGRTTRGGPRRLPRGPVAAGLEAGWTVSLLAGEGVPPGAGDPDQEDRHVA